MKDKKILFILVIFTIMLFLTKGILAGDPTWNESAYNKTYYFNEDTLSYYNFTKNVTDMSEFSYFSVLDISWSEGAQTQHSEFYWLPWEDSGFTNSSTGNMIINATRNNETGNFTLNMLVQGINGGDTNYFNFIINATNDAPVFSDNGINSVYNLSASGQFLSYLNATDEEMHYPLKFNVSFWSNCTHASWSNRSSGENCSLYELGFTLTNTSNTSALMNFTPSINDVGRYWANISVTDSGENYLCPHQYCINSTYQQNKTRVYSNVVLFEIFSSLSIDASNCQNRTFNESQTATCNITIYTKGSNSNITINSTAFLRNYQTPSWINYSWFYAENNTLAQDYTIIAKINVTPSKKEIGNWTINFTVHDNSFNEFEYELINIFVNRTQSSNPNVEYTENINTSIELETSLWFNVSDDDFLIPDKNQSYGGFNETLTINYTILNQSNLNQKLNLSSCYLEILNMPIQGTNITKARIVFTANQSEAGDYTFNISAVDSENNSDYRLVNVTIRNNHYPEWNSSTNTTIILNEDDSLYLNFSENVSDPDGDTLTFSYTLESGVSFPSFVSGFNSATGELNITPSDSDVGFHRVNITVSDGYLNSTEEFNFTIHNINDSTSFFPPLQVENATRINDSLVNATEDNITKISIYMKDNDLLIPDVQVARGFYDENLSVVNTTVINTSNGQVVNNLMNFTFSDVYPADHSIWIFQTIFTPSKAFIGQYNITFYLKDAHNIEFNKSFVLNVNAINHAPSISGVSNFSKLINETVYFDFNASDIEDGNDSMGNLIFSISFIQGQDFIDGNESIFNTTSGILNITFNDTQAGAYHLNLSVKDTGGLNTSKDFWIYVYDKPVFISPSENSVFNLTENSTGYLIFIVNHSVQDNLTYEFWIDSINCSYQNSSNCTYGSLSLRGLEEGYGNGTSFNWSFAPNFTDETYSNLKNLTVIVYPNSSLLSSEQRANLTINRTFKLNISHSNAPVQFIQTIDKKGPVPYTSTIEVSLSDYFRDYDYLDSYYHTGSNIAGDAKVNFIAQGNTNSITASFTEWTLVFSASSAVSGIFNITAQDSLVNETSNNFVVEFNNPAQQIVHSTTTKIEEVPVSLKIIVPSEVSVFSGGEIIVPVSLQNDGQKDLKGINLSGVIAKDSVLRSDFNISFAQDFFDELKVGETVNTTLLLQVGLVESGVYEMTINATVQDPDYYDWAKIYVNVNEVNKIRNQVLFASDFILENPECAELTEIVNRAKKYMYENKYDEALKLANQAVNACKDILATPGRRKIVQSIDKRIYFYAFLVFLLLTLAAIFYYYYRRFKIEKGEINLNGKDLSNVKDTLIKIKEGYNGQ